jgi:hypothetical protein
VVYSRYYPGNYLERMRKITNNLLVYLISRQRFETSMSGVRIHSVIAMLTRLVLATLLGNTSGYLILHGLSGTRKEKWPRQDRFDCEICFTENVQLET